LLIWFCIGRYNDKMAYGQSKLANILHAKELSRRLRVSFSTKYLAFPFQFLCSRMDLEDIVFV
jgi:hypothetical protein